MTSRLSKDPDLVHFAQNLVRTPEGVKFAKRWTELNNGQVLLRTALQAGNESAIHLLRQSYIQLSDACSEAISDLETKHRWPT